MTDESIELFQKLLKKKYDWEVSKSDALEILTNMAGYFDLLAKIYYREINKDAPGDDPQNIE